MAPKLLRPLHPHIHHEVRGQGAVRHRRVDRQRRRLLVLLPRPRQLPDGTRDQGEGGPQGVKLPRRQLLDNQKYKSGHQKCLLSIHWFCWSCVILLYYGDVTGFNSSDLA